jgi:membrane protein implicated in regulation of membrane protease activity
LAILLAILLTILLAVVLTVLLAVAIPLLGLIIAGVVALVPVLRLLLTVPVCALLILAVITVVLGHAGIEGSREFLRRGAHRDEEGRQGDCQGGGELVHAFFSFMNRIELMAQPVKTIKKLIAF